MTAALDVASWVLLVAGSVFCIIGSFGLVRLGDFYLRIHSAGITDTLGATLILLGLALQAGLTQVTVKLLLVGLFLLLTSPASTHALVKAAFAQGVRAEQEVPSEPTEYPEPGDGS